MGSAVIAAGGFAAFAAAGGSLFAAFALGAGLSLVSRALMPKPDIGTQMGGQSVMTREAAHSRKIIYGRARIGGNVVYLESTGDDNKYLWLVTAIAGHEIDAYEEVWFNDEKIWDGGSYVGNWGSYVSISFKDGSQTTADSGLVAASTKWTSNHKLLDTAYMVVKLTYDQEQFAQGLPNISTVIRGKKVYDAQKDSTSAYYESSLGVSTQRESDASTWQWSQNPALCIRDYLVNTKYGLAESVSNISASSIDTATDVCNEAVDLAAGGTQPRYTMDGVVDTANSIKSNIENMVGSMIGRLVYSGGKFEIHAGEYIAPTVTIDESMMIGEISVQTKQSRRSAYNGVKGVFLSEEDNYILADYPAQISSTYAAQDGDPIYLDMPLPYTVNNVRAQRIAQLALRRSRQQESITIPCNLNALKFKIGDNISVTNTRLGYSAKVFEVVGYSMGFSSDQMVVNVDAIETTSSIWSWDEDEQVFLGAGEVDIYDGTSTTAPASITVTADTFISSDGTSSASFDVSWPTSVDAFIDHYVVEWKEGTQAGSFIAGKEYKILVVGNTNFASIGALANTVGVTFTATAVGSGTGIAVQTGIYYSQQTKSSPLQIVGLDPSKTYDVRVKAVNGLSVSSSYVSAQAVPAADTTAPSVPTSISAVGEYRQITISWTNPTQKDLLGVEVFRSDTETGTYLYVGNGDSSFIDTDLETPKTYYYKVRSYDRSFNKSNYAAIVSATSRNVTITAPDNSEVVIYDGESGIPPSVTNAVATTSSDTNTFYLKQDYKEHLELHVSYPVGALTSGTVSGETNAINAVMSQFKFQIYYAPTSNPTSFTQFGSDLISQRKTTTGQLISNYFVKTTDLGSGNYKAELQTKTQVRTAYPTLSGYQLGIVDDDYNLTEIMTVYDFPSGEYVFKVVVTVTDGSYSPYPATGSPSSTLARTVKAVGYQQVQKSGYSYAFEPYYQPTTIFRDRDSDEVVRLSDGADTLELAAINAQGKPRLLMIGPNTTNPSSGVSWGASINFVTSFDSYTNGGLGEYQIGIDKSGTGLYLGSGGNRPQDSGGSELKITNGRTDVFGTLFLNGTQITGTGSASQAESYPLSQQYDRTLTTTSSTVGSFSIPAPESSISKRQGIDISVLFEITNAGKTAQALSSIDFVVEKKSKGVNAVTVGTVTLEGLSSVGFQQIISVSGNQLGKVDMSGGIAASATASGTNEPSSIYSVYYDSGANKTFLLCNAEGSIFSTGDTLYYSDSKFTASGTWFAPSDTEVINSITPPDPDVNYVNASTVSSGTGTSRFYMPYKMTYGKTTTATDYRIKISVSSIPSGITYKVIKMFGSIQNIA